MNGPVVQYYVRLANGTKLGRANSQALAWHETAKWTPSFVVGAVLVRVTRRKSEARRALHKAAEAWARAAYVEERAAGSEYAAMCRAAIAFARGVKP